tara:strand:- start:3209 stop:3661 length:453 start_codon:yes stop_codon:yes gene_type:complete
MKLKYFKEIVQRHLNIDIKNPSRKFEYIFARSCYYYLCRKFAKSSYAKISGSLNKNHATVMHGLKELPYILKQRKDLNETFNLILAEADRNYIYKNTKMTIDELVMEYNFLLLKNSEHEIKIKKQDKKLKMLKSENKEMKRVIYMMADTD